MVVQNIVFFILAFIACVGAIGVVSSNNIVHAALYLVSVLASVAGLFLLIAAEFIAWVQVLIYIGAVTVLLLFGIMLTRAPMGKNKNLNNASRGPAFVVSFGLLGLLVALILDAYTKSEKIILGGLGANETLANGKMAAMSESIIYKYVFPFEIVGVLLLGALIGAVVMARKD
ncbi:MAG: NADH-quinone oxidoreductase subunit J [Acidimicrobiia bacterium]